jgi:hypothetical protein
MKCKSHQDWQDKKETNEFMKALNPSLMCFDVHCEDVYDPFDGIAKKHKSCTQEKCVSDE